MVRRPKPTQASATAATSKATVGRSDEQGGRSGKTSHREGRASGAQEHNQSRASRAQRGGPRRSSPSASGSSRPAYNPPPRANPGRIPGERVQLSMFPSPPLALGGVRSGGQFARNLNLGRRTAERVACESHLNSHDQVFDQVSLGLRRVPQHDAKGTPFRFPSAGTETPRRVRPRGPAPAISHQESPRALSAVVRLGRCGANSRYSA